ncbi:MAG TPA: hypothetical protein VGF32_14575 [Streptosporangiaceae bacterium]|jgi:hypothetical protein
MSTVTMQELEHESAELLPARETLTHCGCRSSSGGVNVLSGNNFNVLSGNLSGNGIGILGVGVGGSGNGSIFG